ncbi:MAG: hypothetical protein DBP00_07340 [gamma proteobacterium symbiont of Ctena orbiculata]|jgi:hypothetical protein|nr:MAG: hypothetical protein DBP00_07340 [gamma proteobacterium symbiont of Ctena orbiculata]
MNYETKTRKGYNGWEATSEALIGETPEGNRILKLRTAKGRIGLSASASVCIRKNEGTGFVCETTEIFGDFYKSGIAITECRRVTEKAVIEVHARALQEMDNLIEQAKVFYAGA